jgi:ANTAR domain
VLTVRRFVGTRKGEAMPIGPAQLASSLGALDGLEVDQGLEVTLPQVLGSAKTLLAADRAVLMLIDQTGALRWASGSDRVVKAVASDLSMPIHVGSGPVGTLDVCVSTPRQWDDSEWAALQAYAGLLASLLVAAATAPLPGRLTDQLQEAIAHRSLIQQAIQILVDREGLDAPAALGWLEEAARSSGDALVQMARAVIAGAPLPSDRLAQARAQRREVTDREVAGHRRDSELHEGAAQRYERGGQAGRAQTERLQAAAARGRILDAEAEQRRADREP